MSLIIEIPENSDSYYDYECKKCGRRIKFTTAFFKAGFEFPAETACAKCGEPFIIDLKRTELKL